MEKAQLDEQLSVTNNPVNNDLAIEQVDMDIDIKVINSAKGPGTQFSYLSSIDDNLSDKVQNNWSC